MTSYQGYNLGFRIYTIDGDYAGSSHALLDHQSWFLDLGEANKNNVTKWQYGYSAKVRSHNSAKVSCHGRLSVEVLNDTGDLLAFSPNCS